MKTLETLPQDIYNLLDPCTDHTINEENLEYFLNELGDLLRFRLKKVENNRGPLRISALGKPDRQLWYDAHDDGTGEKMSGKNILKFLYGDVIEALVLLLAKEAGHTVEKQQAEVEVGGVLGHIDAIIDGVLVDVKSAAPFSYARFANGAVVETNPFGYVDQLAGYASVLTPNQDAAWLAFDKVSADMCVTKLDTSIINFHQPGPRIEHLKEVLEQETPPPLCAQPEPDGKSGNMKLSTLCSYCKWKKRCHPGVRTFLYSNGPRYLTTVKKVPDVPEV